MRNILIVLFFIVVLVGDLSSELERLPYFYPFVNPYEATVIPLPEAYRLKLPEKIPTKKFTLNIFPDREIPKVFWYQDGLKCSLNRQKHRAPLVFVIAGTGAHYRSQNMIYLQKILYQAGFHVICISSPTYMNFIVNASTGMPGNTPEDAKDLYRVMIKADAYARKKRTKISGYALTGYSLGGIEAAFVSKLDDERKVFNFSRVLLINPPANVYTSINNLNNLLIDNIPGGPDNFAQWFYGALQKLTAEAETIDDLNFTSESVYRLYRYYPPREDFLKALIGLAFRMDSANLVFTTDVMNGGGYIVPKGLELTTSSSLTEYAMTSYHTSFVDYFDEWFFPFYERQEPGLKKDDLIKRSSLYALEAYLKENHRIGLIHNEDDVIMDAGEVDYLHRVFGDRAKIFPTGGHCGNIAHPDVAKFMVDFLSFEEEVE
jgi:hypothetical protein